MEWGENAAWGLLENCHMRKDRTSFTAPVPWERRWPLFAPLCWYRRLRNPFFNCIHLLLKRAAAGSGYGVSQVSHGTAWESSFCCLSILSAPVWPSKCVLCHSSVLRNPHSHTYTGSLLPRSSMYLHWFLQQLFFKKFLIAFFPVHRHMQLAQWSLMVGTGGREKGCVWTKGVAPCW